MIYTFIFLIILVTFDGIISVFNKRLFWRSEAFNLSPDYVIGIDHIGKTLVRQEGNMVHNKLISCSARKTTTPSAPLQPANQSTWDVRMTIDYCSSLQIDQSHTCITFQKSIMQGYFISI